MPVVYGVLGQMGTVRARALNRYVRAHSGGRVGRSTRQVGLKILLHGSAA